MASKGFPSRTQQASARVTSQPERIVLQTRHYGMDWLRIGAFALLILYHIGMVFVPWGYHAKAPATLEWVAVPMLLISPWRLMLLFLVAGYASRSLLARSDGLRAFLANRTARLLIPLLFGVIVLVPPQAWVELASQRGYAGDFATLALRDFWSFAAINGLPLPNWNHLWFVGYLWSYTLVLVALAALPWGTGLQRAFDATFAGGRALALPLVWLLLMQVVLVQRWTDTHALIDDWAAHLAYLPSFLFGFGLARSDRVMAGMRRWWAPALAAALLSYAFVAWVTLSYPTTVRAPQILADATTWARQVQCWAMIVALIGLADRYANRDHSLRATLTEAVFPFYLIHQTVIVVAAYWLGQAALPPAGLFALLAAVTVGGCWLFYLGGREIGWLRPLIGLKRRPAARPLTMATAIT